MSFPSLCQACGGTMRSLNEWVAACPHCGFQASTLKASEGTGIPGLETLRRENFEHLLDRLDKLKPLAGTRLLEVGSAWGWFLEAAERRGVLAHGIEPEADNAELASAKGLSVECGFFPSDLRDKGPYDIIVFNDVFEHLPNPPAVLKDVQALLAPGGLAVFNYPSSRGILFLIATNLARIGFGSLLGRLWQKGLPSPHVSYFHPGNLDRMVRHHTTLVPLTNFPLRSVSRQGLKARISSSHTGIIGATLFAGVWCLSFVLPCLPADIQVSIFGT